MRKPRYIVYRILRPIINLLFILLYRPSIVGKENIPKKGRVVVCGNHMHNWDSAMLISSTKRTVHFLAKDELFKGFGKYFFKAMACIPVNRRQKDHNAMDSAISVLKQDELIGIFPEGTFNRTSDIIMPFKYGAVSMAYKTNSTIVPFSITGEYKIFKRNSIKICFGKAYKIKTDNLTEANDELMEKVKELIIKNRNGERHE